MLKHIKALDGLRGIAILLVLVHHLLQYRPDHSILGRVINGIAGVGWSGVSLFFVLSGFLITGILFDSKGSDHFFRNFYARRTLRIFPLYYAFVFLCTVVFPLWSVTAAAKPPDSSWMWWCYLSNYHYAFRHGPEGWLNSFWSLAVEEHFYLVWPAFVFLLGRVTLMRVAACFMVLGECFRAYFIMHHNIYAPYVWTPCRMDDLALGALVALAIRGEGEISPIRRVAWVLAPLSGAVAIAITLWKHAVVWGPVMQLVGMPAFSIFFASLLVLALPSSKESAWSQFLGTGFLRTFGKYSYGLYVFHQAVASLIGPVVLLPATMVRTNDLITLLVQALISFGLALVSWNLFEKHFLRMKKYFENRSPNRADLGPRVEGLA